MTPNLFRAVASLALFLASEIAVAQPYGLASRLKVGPFVDLVLPPVLPAEPTSGSAVNTLPYLTFQNPMGLELLPGTNNLFVWERDSRIWLIDNSPDATHIKSRRDVPN